MDELAHRVGDLLLSWPAEVRPALLTWTRSDDRWLRRASIICQLGTRDRNDVELLKLAPGVRREAATRIHNGSVSEGKTQVGRCCASPGRTTRQR